MADSFFGFDTSLSNLNDDEGGGGPSEDEYDALNDETFGQDSDELDWEVEHEQLAVQLESSRRHNSGIDDTANTQLEASLSQLVLDETDSPHSRSFGGSSVWRPDLSAFPSAPTPVPTLKNVCTVEELERQLRAKHQQNYTNQSYFQPRFPVILQRPPGLQAPVPLPFAPQQPMNHTINHHSQPLNNLMGQNNQMPQNNMLQSQVNQLGQFMQNNQFQNQNNLLNQMAQNLNVHQMPQNNQLMGQNMNMTQGMPQMNQNQMGQTLNHMGQNLNQLGQSQNQMGQSMNQMGQSQNQMGQNLSQMGQNLNQLNHLAKNSNQIGQSMGQSNQLNQNLNQMGQNMNQMGQATKQMNQMSQTSNQLGNLNQLGSNAMGQNVNQLGQNVNQMGQNVNQMGQNVNQMMSNGQYPAMNQYQHMMGQPRMIAPPPGMNMPRQNFNPNMGQYNPNFRGPTMQSKPTELNQQNMHSQMMIKTQPQTISTTKTSPNQSPQSKSLNSKMAKVDQKVQKSRVYNNSKTMTSQNLVQLIQNTHPMLQFNNTSNSYHNASHHPMLGRNNVYTNSQFNHPLYNQGRNGSFSDRHSLNGDDASGSESDVYAGLMTQREKQWLINIQMLQLNTGTPYIHDFYYTVFLERQASKEKAGVKEAHKANQQNHPFYSGGVSESDARRSRHNSLRHNSAGEEGAAPRAYVPTQFENSLGKLQCGSVTAPRKIIDVEVVDSERAPGRLSRAPSVASTTHPQEIPRETKRTKQLLLDIEALYLILLRIEELNDPLAISNALIMKEREEKQKQLLLLDSLTAQKDAEDHDESNLFLKNIESVQRRPKQDSPKSESVDKRQVVNLAVSQKPAPVKNLLDEDKDELMNRMFAGLLHSDRLTQMMTVRKGKALVSRFVSRVPATHGRLRALWARVLRALTAAARRDDGGLAALAPHYRKYIQNTTGWSAILESCSLLSEAFDPARTPYALTTPFTLSCVCALMEKATLLITTPEATSNERQWSKFLKTLVRALKNTTLNVARPIQPMPENKLMYHIRQIESRSTIEILQRGKSAEFADLSKTDISEQLLNHLC